MDGKEVVPMPSEQEDPDLQELDPLEEDAAIEEYLGSLGNWAVPATLNPEEVALVAAIHDDPKNDAPRLAYAEWCAEHDLLDLAELIRLMCREPYFELKMSRTPPWKATLRDKRRVQQSEPERIRRSIEVLKSIYGSKRLSENPFEVIFWRGLPVCKISQTEYPVLLDQNQLAALPLARFDLWLRCERPSNWLAHPIMNQVDTLILWPMDENCESRLITREDLSALLVTPFIGHLDDLILWNDLQNDTKDLVEKLQMWGFLDDLDYGSENAETENEDTEDDEAETS
jgi:uncharacterized protein (TIGR02996 family)